jgi:hypothetical protein
MEAIINDILWGVILKNALKAILLISLCLACGGEETTTMANPGQGGATGGNGGGAGAVPGGGGSAGSGGEPPAMQGGGTLPMDVADCERGCLSARQCDVDVCYSDVSGRLITSCVQACQSGDRTAFASLAQGACPESGQQALSLLGLTNECIGERSRCAECSVEGDVCVNGACGVFNCVTDAFDDAGNDAASAETVAAEDTVLTGRTVCMGDEDWYRFDVPAGQNLFVDTVFVHGIGDVDVKVFDTADAEVTVYSSASATDNETIVIPAANMPRSFLLQVFPFRDAQNQYEIHFNYDVPLAVCSSSSQCPMGQECSSNACAPIPPCLSDEDCGFGASICDLNSGICFDCLVTEDCNSGVCENNECVECVADGDCMAGRCQENVCVECVGDADCMSGDVCLGSVCGPASCLDSLEPNNTEETAVPIVTGMSYEGVYICNDKDYYSFSMPAGQAFSVELSFIDELGDIDASVKQDGSTVASGVTTTDNETLFVPARLSGGDFILYVRRLTGGNAELGPDQTYGMFIDTNPEPGQCLNGEDCAENEECSSRRCRPMGYCEGNRQCNSNPDARQCDLTSNMCVPCNQVGAMTTRETPFTINATGHSESNNTCGGPDFFLIDMPVNKTVNIVVSFSHMAGDIDVKLTDSANMTVASGLGVEDMEALEVISEVGGPHILEIYGVGGVYNEYQLQVSTQ